ncbi:carbon-nitrogen family hydrolase [Anaeroselena agilis]|uniref:Carbon-nitrogen family hydrolase n=1 Tax=Anaeroselena agilis TaxID=3063788 RepID=A0ABU3NZE4_9FIRM|nr:carbon-nitrogen family hydrolase [Selenomonadales bacterium 4137-cl]
MKIAMVQMRIIAGDVAANRARGLALAAEAAANAAVVVLPEIWTTGYALRQVADMAEDQDGPTLTGMREIAAREGVTVVAGSLALRRQGRIYNESVVIGPDGSTIANYAKIHLFSMTGEERFFAAGDRRCLFDVGGLRAGLAICYDLRFPELFRLLAGDGAQVVFMPSEWPLVRALPWQVLCRARAMENQTYICAVNCVGEHRGSPFAGQSLLIAPDGEIVAAGGAEEAVIYGEIDPAAVAAVRETMKVWQDRRPEVYL